MSFGICSACEAYSYLPEHDDTCEACMERLIDEADDLAWQAILNRARAEAMDEYNKKHRKWPWQKVGS